MKFKEWFLIEMPHHVIRNDNGPSAIKINGIACDMIDFRFEDWSRGSNPLKTTTRPRQMQQYSREEMVGFYHTSFSAPLYNNTWLNVTVKGPNIKITVTPNALHTRLPPEWFDFACFYRNEVVVKEPEWPRSDYERIRPDLGSAAVPSPVSNIER